MPTVQKRLLVASNRLPVRIVKSEAGSWTVQPGHGGLVTALAPVLKKNGGLWIGWAGNDEEINVGEVLNQAARNFAFDMKPVLLSTDEVEKYYRGFSNETLWPLFHDLLGHSKFDRENWRVYQEVNRRFSEIIAPEIRENDFVWIQDYQLIMVGQFLRQLNVQHPLAYFLHIPFPALDLFRRLPWRDVIMQALMDYDLLGFQTLRDRRNFVQCVRALIPNIQIDIHRRYALIKHDGRTIKAGNYPIGIDFDEFNNAARDERVAEAAWYLHENLAGTQVILGIDRLDYTKGIPERLLAYEHLLEKYPELHGKITLLQVVVPSRTYVPDYQNLRKLLDELVGHINSRFAHHGWVPIHYMFRSLDRSQLLGHYKACEIALITPLRDGMNLIAKEYCASSIDLNGVLILSEFAGAAEQLSKGALIVNPYNLEGTADAIYQAFNMDLDERKKRMQLLQTEVKRNNVHRWVRLFMSSMIETQSLSPATASDSDGSMEITSSSQFH